MQWYTSDHFSAIEANNHEESSPAPHAVFLNSLIALELFTRIDQSYLTRLKCHLGSYLLEYHIARVCGFGSNLATFIGDALNRQTYLLCHLCSKKYNIQIPKSNTFILKQSNNNKLRDIGFLFRGKKYNNFWQIVQNSNYIVRYVIEGLVLFTSHPLSI